MTPPQEPPPEPGPSDELIARVLWEVFCKPQPQEEQSQDEQAA